MKTKQIESVQNPFIKNLKKLQDKKYRNKENLYIIEGLRLVKEALRQNAKIKHILYDSSKEDIFQSILEKEELKNIEVIEVNNDVISILSSTKTPQGIIAIVEIEKRDLINTKGKYIYLDAIQDPGNLGTIIRSSHAFNIEGIILSEGSTDPYSDKSIRSSMGSLFKVNIYFDDKERSVLKKLINDDFKLYITSLENSKPIKDTNFYEKSVIVIGNEANGVKEDIFLFDHESIIIPMPGLSESLNAAIATSIILYEVSR